MGAGRAGQVVSACALLAVAAGCGAPVTLQGRTAGAAPRTVLQANDAGDGHLKWQIDLGPSDDATEPVLVGDVVVVGRPGSGATAYDVDNGRIRWAVPKAGLPAVVTGGLAVFDFADRIEARRADTGAVAWTRKTAGDLIQAHAGGPLALVVDPAPERSAAKAPHASAKPVRSRVALLSAATGRNTWLAVLPGRVDPTNSAVSDRHILATYATDYSGRNTVAALRMANGVAEWSYPASPVNAVSAAGEIPAVTVGLDRARAEALDPSTGHPLWEAPEDDMLDSRLAPFLGQDGMRAFRRDPLTGARLPGEVPAAYGVGAHGDLLVGAAGQTLTAVRDGAEAWTADVAPGAEPVTYLDVDDRVVVSVTAVGQKHPRD